MSKDKSSHASFIYNIPIKAQLTFMGMFLCIVTTLTLSLAFIKYDTQNAKNSIKDELSMLSRIIGNRVIPAIDYDLPEQAESNLNDLKAIKYILLACIFTDDNAIFAQYKQEEFSDTCDKYATLQQRSDLINSYQPIKINNSTRGHIFILSDLRRVDQHIEEFSYKLLGIVFAVLAISYLLTYMIQRIISTPIASLVDITEHVQSGDYTVRTQELGTAELGKLAKGFNKMMEVIHRRDQQLKKSHESLEKKVAQRTADLEEEKIKAEAANEAKSEFLRNMSHEFRTPLHGMNSFSIFGINEYETADREDLKRYFERINVTTQRLTTLVDGVLNIAKMEDGSEVFNMQRYPLASITDIISMEQPTAMSDKNLTFSMKAPKQKLHLVCDRDKIVQVLVNLLGNAAKFSSEGQTISLKIKKGKDKDGTGNITFMVSDQGVGIPEGEHEAIFKKFVQSTRTKTQAGGTGLGLSISAGIVRSHGGKIWVEDNPGGGAIFIFTIPDNNPEGEVTSVGAEL